MATTMADRDGYIWYDGKLVPWRAATTHVLTHSLHYGLAVFEGIRAYNTVDGTAVFRLQEHIDRLYNSAHIYMMKIPYARRRIIEAHKEVVRANKLHECYLRPIAFYGSEKMGVSPEGRDGPRRHRRLALGRLPRRRGAGERHPRQDLVVRAPPRERVDVPRQVFRHLRQLHPGEPGSARPRLRRGPAARRRRLRRRRRGREPVPGQERPHLRAGADLGADGHHPRQRDHARRATSATRSRRGASPATTCTSPTRPSSPAPPPKSRRSAKSTGARSAPAAAARSRASCKRRSSKWSMGAAHKRHAHWLAPVDASVKRPQASQNAEASQTAQAAKGR